MKLNINVTINELLHFIIAPMICTAVFTETVVHNTCSDTQGRQCCNFYMAGSEVDSDGQQEKGSVCAASSCVVLHYHVDIPILMLTVKFSPGILHLFLLGSQIIYKYKNSVIII